MLVSRRNDCKGRDLMTILPFNSDNYDRNFELFSSRDPLAAYQLEGILQQEEFTPCKTTKGEPNLFKRKFGIDDYLHAQTGALEEASTSISPELLEKGEILYIYGLGLGYFYEVLQPWLLQNPQRHVIFLEDNLEIIYYFLFTNTASSLLQNSQVTLFYFRNYQSDYESFCKLNSAFINRPIEFLTLPYYALRKEMEALALCYVILHDHKILEALHNEYLSGQKGFLTNFYQNIFHLPQSHFATNLFDRFKNIPAIICGAGPSLEKNIHKLKDLGQNALIFAGGSSLNVLNHAGIQPHFGLGLDPNPEQTHRLLTNHTFHIPFLYRLRISHAAFQLMQGPKIYVSGSTNQLASWFEKELDIAGPQLDEGHNVVNLCTEIAHKMGCNPIIYVGMDLAYTEIQPYAKGISTHPLWIDISQPYQTGDQKAVLRTDIFNQWIKTKWEWIAEANWLGQFAKHHSDIQMINATEGGLGFPSVPNLSLEEVSNLYLAKTYDISNWVHAEIQNQPPKITKPALLNLINQLKNSLDRCLEAYRSTIKTKQTVQIFASSTTNFFDTQTIITDSSIKTEIGYRHFLDMFDMAYQYLQKSHQLIHAKKSNEFQETLERFCFLEEVLSQNIQLMNEGIQKFIFSPPPIALTYQKRAFSHSMGEIYRFEDGRLEIQDPELGICIQETFHPNLNTDRLAAFFPNGQLQYEMFYDQQLLHGPSRFYQENGQLLAESWFIKGKRVGKTIQYFNQGNLYSVGRYKEGLLHGKQEYFYANGSPHIVTHYFNGLLNGEVFVYTQDSKIIRELHYLSGKRHGVEKMWDQTGQQILECHYQEGVPTGKAIQWNLKGEKRKEVMIYHFPNDFDLKIWDEQGQCIKSYERGIENFSYIYEQTQKKADNLEETLKNILQQMDPIVEQHLTQSKDVDLKLAEDFAGLKDALKGMQNLKELLTETMKENLKHAEELKKNKEKKPS
ncbi:unnamed protein product [Candidatus Protochlamydia amoebophila UWE25]|uniref:6-hydroxymethylpterin diphosphokinase MptE-like domain-containing protein n=2 Tax=Candidatus Protochlamydia amoebophila TaxID=362787 RepID=A0A2P9HA26_PARUW|nr:unnamed protein product [Candidatus Protochlamydia amoebophila UWE25]